MGRPWGRCGLGRTVLLGDRGRRRMLMRRRSAVVTTVLCGVLAAAGCASTESGKAQPSTSADQAAATAALWDPCGQIPDGTLVGLGMKPASKESGIFGVEEPGWKICRWTED
ncbi:DUF3558 family protein, partial [Nocardia salmonicida]|uniref:DUF3558 family protein n=1 Tax=Nocardia salmonicida TaxID=53431 RepID=UPI00365E89BC